MPIFASVNGPATLLATSVFATLLGAAALWDWRTRRIPNRLVGALACTGIIASAVSGGAWSGLARGTAGIAVGLFIWLPFFAMRWIGAGDVKLFAAAGAWLGPARTLEGALVAALLGGVLAIAALVHAHGTRNTAARIAVGVAAPGTLRPGPLDARSPRAIPYGVSLALGALAAAWLPPLLHGGAGAIH
jgi:prepilin peptidase CpaA